MMDSRETQRRFVRIAAFAVVVSAGLMVLATVSTPAESRASTQAGSSIPTRKASHVTRLVIPILARNEGDPVWQTSTPTAGVPTSTPAPTSPPEVTSTAIPTQTSIPMQTSIPTGASIRVGSQNGRASLANAHQVYAIIVNDGGGPAYDSALKVTYLDDSERTMGVGNGITALKMIRPGESSSVVAHGLPLSGWTHYRTSLVSQSTSSINLVHDGLIVSGLSASRVGAIITITGQAKNDTAQPVGNVKIDISLFTPDGTIVDAKVANLFTTNDAAPGTSAIFGGSIVNSDGRIPPNFVYTARAEGLGR